MNSDVISSGGGRNSREHRRYLSIGESEGSAIFEDEDDSGGGFSSNWRGSRGLFSRAKGVAEGGEDDGRRVNGKENVDGPTREARVFGGMTKLGPPGGRTSKFSKSPTGSMYDGDGFLRELDAWLR